MIHIRDSRDGTYNCFFRDLAVGEYYISGHRADPMTSLCLKLSDDNKKSAWNVHRGEFIDALPANEVTAVEVMVVVRANKHKGG